MIAYNHEQFIVQALDGVLNQECDFDVEVILSNDCSTDGTHEKITEFLKNHHRKSWVKYSNQGKNLGMMPNFIFALNECKGQYIALCEGDDYWTDTKKLQKQVDFLEANPDYSICFHKVKILKDGELLDEDVTERRFNKIKNSPIGAIDLIQHGNFIHTPSVMFKNGNLDLPFEFAYSTVGDYFLHVINAQKGYIKRLDDIMAVYRQGVGIFSSIDNLEMQKRILIYESCMLSYLSNNDQKEILLKKHVNKLNTIGTTFLNVDFLAENLNFKKLFKVLFKKLKR